ncbi:MAG: FAD-binding oxidoreductase [Gammaproteobacteria bacterium]|nr:FAD-binding oxidoreductase [Gammaproteobacteria bacterium]MDH3480187.1 FAD-binding oxidoreductase [Gammaproteobacteria bacterium]
MPPNDTLSHRPRLRFWGWGNADEQLTPAEEARLLEIAKGVSHEGFLPTTPPRVEEFSFPEAQVRVPDSLASIISTTPYDRLTHAYGKSWADGARMCLRQLPSQPLLVAFPRDEQQISDVLEWAERERLAVIPFGGGTSVCGGMEAVGADDSRAVVSLDLQYLNRVLEIDHASRAARIQGGALGPELEAELRPHGLTLRYFPQSFQFSTLGGWIATRGGGHYATVYTHIDDFVQSTRMLTPRGVLQTARLPGSGAGPAPDRLVLGSEGIFGVITEAWMRLQHRPQFRASASVAFPDLPSACSAVRAISQAALFPANCRLLDAAEARANGVGNSPTLVLGFESADHELDAWMQRALELCADHGGAAQEQREKRDASGTWRSAFLRMPYYRNFLTPLGLIADTFETAVTWDRFDEFYAGVKQRVGQAIERSCGHPPMISCRFTHVYPDGPAPYFTFYAVGTTSGDMASALSRWRDIKAAANEAVVSLGGTSTHHHAVGRDHRSAYELETPALLRAALAGVKQTLDPEGILNPGVLIDPAGKPVGVRGAMQ